ncbi:MAG: hypothetical protein FXF54_04715 [Kosmotoga sp.]|nr:MAG: hypothetical protein FXF54_04715 [Kosmotoga sp.]
MISDSTILRRSVKDNKLYGITIIGFRKGLNNGILNRDADNPLFPLSKEFYMKKLMEIANKEFK